MGEDMKVNNKHFIDWESETFGYGYGTGEVYTLKALKDFYDCLINGSYDYRQLEKKLGKTVAWLMINILCKADIIDYGTSPRFGWLSTKGELLKDFIEHKSVNELYKITDVDENYIYCYSTHCNCLEPCNNPLF